MEDHFSLNVAKRVKPDSERFGPYHQHYCRITIPAGTTKREAGEVFEDLCKRFPEPEFRVDLQRNSYRTAMVRSSSGGKAG